MKLSRAHKDLLLFSQLWFFLKLPWSNFHYQHIYTSLTTNYVYFYLKQQFILFVQNSSSSARSCFAHNLWVLAVPELVHPAPPPPTEMSLGIDEDFRYKTHMLLRNGLLTQRKNLKYIINPSLIHEYFIFQIILDFSNIPEFKRSLWLTYLFVSKDKTSLIVFFFFFFGHTISELTCLLIDIFWVILCLHLS